MKGWLAIDVDGTLTHEKYSIPEAVISFLRDLDKDGWKLIVVTGRSYPFAMPSVKKIDFPFILSTQNGSTAWHMPQKELIFERFIEKSAIKIMEKTALGYDLAFIVYGADYKCYWKRDDFYLDYVKKLMDLSMMTFDEVKDGFETIPMDLFPLAKFAGQKERVAKLKKELEKHNLFEMSLIEDPFYQDFHLLLITQKGVTKGSAISEIVKVHDKKPVIAAGNDENDITMFERADLAIAMEDSPAHVLKGADIIAPSAKKNGIIQGLKSAIACLN